jgi:hypothetical protein
LHPPLSRSFTTSERSKIKNKPKTNVLVDSWLKGSGYLGFVCFTLLLFAYVCFLFAYACLILVLFGYPAHLISPYQSQRLPLFLPVHFTRTPQAPGFTG